MTKHKPKHTTNKQKLSAFMLQHAWLLLALTGILVIILDTVLAFVN